MKPAARIRLDSIKPKRRRGDGTVTYMRRTKFLQMTADLTAWQASLVLDGGHAEAKLRGDAQ